MNADNYSNNKNDLKPHTKTLETNTIRIKSWRNLLLSKRTPAVILITIGFFMIAFLPAYAVVNDSNVDETSDKASELTDHDGSADQTALDEVENTVNPEPTADADSAGSASEPSSDRTTSVEIRSNTSGQAASETNSSLSINGQEVDIPKNGTYRETIKTEDGTSRIRARVDNNSSDVSISIKHSSDTEVE